MTATDPAELRRTYRRGALDETAIAPGWAPQLRAWFDEAVADARSPEPNALQLATVDADGHPSLRTVLAKAIDERGVSFYTNYDSAKGRELAARPYAAAQFLWLDMERQVRLRGAVQRVSTAETEVYFHSRPRGSQLGAWASPQSQVIASRAVLEHGRDEVTARFGDGEIDVPPFWGGYRLEPDSVEFWQGRPDRLHDRLRFRRVHDDWLLERLAPVSVDPVSSPAVDVVAIRRELHTHPELAFAETRTTALIVERLSAMGLRPTVLAGGTGVVCDVGSATGAPVALRADIDALPITDEKDVPYRSQHDGVCHGCGHDAHTAILLGAAAELARRDLGPVRLLFQPAEETTPGGAPAVLASGALDGVRQIFALHCDPRVDTGQVGLRVGPITAACDQLDIRFTGPGGHTARPHLTADLVYAIGLVITELPGLLSRRIDPRAGASVVGSVDAGRAANAIPMSGMLRGTLRVLDREAWKHAEPLVRTLIDEIVVPTGVRARLAYGQGVPPVVNEAGAVEVQRAAVLAALGPDALVDTEQSMGGEDFAWYLDTIPGALARLGCAPPGGEAFDLHQGTFDLDEDALAIGVRYTVALAEHALGQ